MLKERLNTRSHGKQEKRKCFPTSDLQSIHVESRNGSSSGWSAIITPFQNCNPYVLGVHLKARTGDYGRVFFVFLFFDPFPRWFAKITTILHCTPYMPRAVLETRTSSRQGSPNFSLKVHTCWERGWKLEQVISKNHPISKLQSVIAEGKMEFRSRGQQKIACQHQICNPYVWKAGMKARVGDQHKSPN
jgi:hypothetical protein